MAEFLSRLLRLSLEGGVLVLVVLLLRLIFKRAPAWTRPALWALVALRLVLPVFPSSPVSLMPPVSEVSTAVVEFAARDRVLSPAAPDGEAHPDADPAQTQPTPTKNAPQVTVVLGDQTPASVKTRAPVGVRLLFSGWALGVTLMLGFGLWSLLRLWQRVRVRVKAEDGVYLSDGAPAPFLLGVFRPKIYLPSSLPETARESVLLHERAHIRRGDPAVKAFSYLLLCVYWFQPLFWLAFFLLSKDLEAACDARVVKTLSKEARADYAEALLALSAGKKRPLLLPPAFGETGVKGRVKAVLSPKKPVLWLGAVSIVLLVAAALLFLPGNGVMSHRDELGGISFSSKSKAEREAWAAFVAGKTDTCTLLSSDGEDRGVLTRDAGTYVLNEYGAQKRFSILACEPHYAQEAWSSPYSERWVLKKDPGDAGELVFLDTFSFSSRAEDFGTPPDFIAQAVTAAGLAGRSPVFTGGGAVYTDKDGVTYYCRAGEKPKSLSFLEEEGELRAVFSTSGWLLRTAAAEGAFVVTASDSLFTGLHYTLVQAYDTSTPGAAALKWTALNSAADSYAQVLLRDGRVWILGERKVENSRSELLVRCQSAETGEVLFERAYGGSGSEKFLNAAPTDEGLVLFISTDSVDGDFGFAENGESIYSQIVLDENGGIAHAEKMAKGAYIPPSPEGGVFDRGNKTDRLPDGGKKGLEITNTVPLADGNYVLVRRHVLGDYPYPDARGTSAVFAEYIYTGYSAGNTAVWQFASPVRVEIS